jgi:hypothetical protein
VVLFLRVWSDPEDSPHMLPGSTSQVAALLESAPVYILQVHDMLPPPEK